MGLFDESTSKEMKQVSWAQEFQPTLSKPRRQSWDEERMVSHRNLWFLSFESKVRTGAKRAIGSLLLPKGEGRAEMLNSRNENV